MIIVKVLGGLGNQLFQVAFAKMLSMETNEEIYLDTSVYKSYKIRDFSIANFKIEKTLKYINDAELSLPNKLFLITSQKVYHIYQLMVKLITRHNRIGEVPYKILTKYGLYYNFDVYYYDSSYNNSNIKSLYGYFQSEKYFDKYKPQIVEELKVITPLKESEKKLIEEIKISNSVGVSIRLGDDYVKSPLLNVCKEDFYYRGMEYIYNQNKDVVFYIFSDRIDRVKEQFNFKYPVRYIEGFKDYESLRLMYSCKHFVISNSSFSWWGAYLSEYKNKIVVAPNKWRINHKEQPDICWHEMILIDV
jgi:hypothetical protein